MKFSHVCCAPVKYSIWKSANLCSNWIFQIAQHRNGCWYANRPRFHSLVITINHINSAWKFTPTRFWMKQRQIMNKPRENNYWVANRVYKKSSFSSFRFYLLAPKVLLDYLRQRSTRATFSTSRREWEFLLFNLAHRDETRIFWHLISGFEIENNSSSISVIETR